MRNRHTGHINAYKRDVIKKAGRARHQCSRGHVYTSAYVGDPHLGGKSIVRLFDELPK